MGNNCCAATSNFETTAAAESGQKPLRTELQQPLRSPEQLLVEELRQAKSFPSSSRSSEFLLKSAPPGTKGDLEFVNHTFPCLAPCKDQGNSVLLRSPEVLFSQRFLRVIRLHRYLALWANLARS